MRRTLADYPVGLQDPERDLRVGNDRPGRAVNDVLPSSEGTDPWPLIYSVHGSGMLVGGRYLGPPTSTLFTPSPTPDYGAGELVAQSPRQAGTGGPPCHKTERPSFCLSFPLALRPATAGLG